MAAVCTQFVVFLPLSSGDVIGNILAMDRRSLDI